MMLVSKIKSLLPNRILSLKNVNAQGQRIADEIFYNETTIIARSMSNWHHSLNMTNCFFHRINVKSATWFEHHTLFFFFTKQAGSRIKISLLHTAIATFTTFIGCKQHKCIECVALWQGNTCTEARCTLCTVFQSVVLQLRVRNLLRPTLHEPKCGHCCSFPWKTSSTNWTLQGWTKSFPWLLVKAAFNLTSITVCLGNLQCANTLSCFILIHPNQSVWHKATGMKCCFSFLFIATAFCSPQVVAKYTARRWKKHGGLQLRFCCVCIYIVNIHN